MKRKGFTLIELLVVISIIALLLAILMPALTKVKEQARAIICRTNVKSLSLAWILYAETHNDNLVGANDRGFRPASTPPYFDWVDRPMDSFGGYVNVDVASREDIERGMQNGLLWEHLGEIKAYSCPADKRMAKARSFSIAASMNGPWGTFYPYYKKMANIVRPSRKYVFVEEETDVGGTNWGAWALNPDAGSWVDPLSVRHGQKATTLGFADGHSELIKWKNESTIEMCINQTFNVIPTPPDTEDYEYMEDGWAESGRNTY